MLSKEEIKVNKILDGTAKMKKLTILFIVIAIFTLIAFAPAIITYAAPEDTGEVSTTDISTDTSKEDVGTVGDAGDSVIDLNQNMLDTSYSHDCQISIEYYLEPGNPDIGLADLLVYFYEKNTKGTIYRATIPWRKITVDMTTLENSGFVSQTYYLPTGEYSFDFIKPYILSNYETFSFQKKLIAKKGEYYRLQVLLGTEEWIEKNKNNNDLIEPIYREMGDTIWDGHSIDSIGDYYSGKKGSAIITDINGEKALVRYEYYRTYVTFTDEQKKDFIASLSHGGEVSKEFADFCKTNGIEILISVDEYDGEGNVDKTKLPPTQVSSSSSAEIPPTLYTTSSSDKSLNPAPQGKSPITVIVILAVVLIGVIVLIKVIRRR